MFYFSFSHFVKLLFCILHFYILGQRKWLPQFLLWKYKEKDDVCGKASNETK